MNRVFLLIAVVIPLTRSKNYFVGPNKLTWEKGEEYCKTQDSNLASIHSEEDLDAAAAECTNRFPLYKGRCFIGLKNVNNKWIWSDGTSSNYGFDTNQDPQPGYPWRQEGEESFNGNDPVLWWTTDAHCGTLDLQNWVFSPDDGFDDHTCNASEYPICNGIACDKDSVGNECESDQDCPACMKCCEEKNICHYKIFSGCAIGYYEQSGVFYGLKKGSGLILSAVAVSDCNVCANLCSSEQLCKSYQCSPTTLRCALIDQANPDAKAVEDFIFCTKQQPQQPL